MPPTPQDPVIGADRPKVDRPVERPYTGNEVVISGISGIFPSSNNMVQFMDNLYNEVDMVRSDSQRWQFNHPEVSSHLGMVDGMSKFDAQFFRVHFKQACTMEPMSRKLLEHAYSAIYDSGINPELIRGKKVGVFIGSSFSESEKIVIYENVQRNGFGITGCNKAMYANRISYWIDGKGPSYALDLACASSMACLEHAYRSISTGQCEAAIVGGCNLCMHPNVSLNMKRAGFLCLDGKTKCFDKNGDGYVRSDAISVMFLQKAKDAKRIYSEVYYAKGNYRLRNDAPFLPIRESEHIREFLEEFYSEIDVLPSEVDYVEAYGAAIAEADANELQAIGQVFGKEKPVLVGSVKSNMGNSEPASGVCAATKVCLAYHKGKLPANLHYKEPQDISVVKDGSVEVVTKETPFSRGFSALNSFSYGGANIHILLKGWHKEKIPDRYKCSIPYLVLASGRQESCVQKILDELKSNLLDPEQIGLLHNIHRYEIPGHMCRGYTILDTNEDKETVCLSQSMEYGSGVKPPVWFVYSGMGSQWPGMGTELMKIPTFAAAIHKCHKALEPKGIDIIKILTYPDKDIFNNILNSFVGIAAVQIGLTDILKEIGIVPDHIIGHSVGELGCAYADGCFTAEEMILSAYSRGLVSVTTPFIRGSMAAVGLGYKTVVGQLPPGIEVACHNSSESSTISGPADIMKEFVAELTARGVFAKEVPCSNIAFHSKYIADFGPGLLKYLNEAIKDPKPRSSKWLSTSVPEDRWDDPIAKYSSAEYHTNNLLNSVLFEETAKHIPSNALVIEIAPHGLLQAILKRSHSECTHLPLTRRGHPNPIKFLLESFGKLYQNALNPKIDLLYPKIEFPVSTQTPFLSQLVEWEHSEDWPEAKYNSREKRIAGERNFVMSIQDDDFSYLKGCTRDGDYVFPESAVLILIWETFGMLKGVDYKELSVVFSNIHFYSEINITNKPLKLNIMIHKGDSKFEVSHDKTLKLSGYITELESNEEVEKVVDVVEKSEDIDITLNAEDIYKILYSKGFCYKGDFQVINSLSADYKRGRLTWKNEWVTFLDGLIQLNIVGRENDSIRSAKLIKELTINTKLHNKNVTVEADGTTTYEAEVNNIYGVTRAGGALMKHIVFVDKPKTKHETSVLETKTFVPHFLSGNTDVSIALQVYLQIVEDNVKNQTIEITELINLDTLNLSKTLRDVAEKKSTDISIKNVDVDNINIMDVLSNKENILKSNILVIDNLIGDKKKMTAIDKYISEDTFIIAVENNTVEINPLNDKTFNVVSATAVQKHSILILMKKTCKIEDKNVIYIPVVNDNAYSWVPRVQNELEKTRRVVLVSETQQYCGLIGLIRNLRQKYGNKVSLIVIDDNNAPSFMPENKIYKEQIQKNLAINVLKNGLWGGYYYLSSANTTHLQNFNLSIQVVGDLDSFTWVESKEFEPSNQLVQVCYAGPSYRDAQKATGKVNMKENGFGMDFSGIDIRGKRVMGLVENGAIASTIEADSDLLWPVPDNWSLEEAATVPFPYVLAYYCLTIRSRLQKGGNVFVTAGAGALGQAVISMCLAHDCTVYTTVSDVQKKRFLLKLFPQLNENNIGNSRDQSFIDVVLLKPEEKHCDIVINCQSGYLRESAMKVAGFTGFFLDLSEYDMVENNSFRMFYLVGEKSYKAVQLSSLFRPENIREKKLIQLRIAEGIANGTVRPLSRITYAPTEVSRAFRLLSLGKHRGRALIRIRDPVVFDQGLEVTPRITYSPKNTYVVVCSGNDLGVQLVERLVRGGARKIVIHLKNKVTGFCYAKLRSLRKYDVSVLLSSEDLQTNEGCKKLLTEASRLGPVEGIFIVLDTSSNVKMEQASFVSTYQKTAVVVKNLDIATRNYFPELSHFVVISHGNQSAVDEYFSTVTEGICQERSEARLPTLAFHIKHLDEYNNDTERNSTKPQSVQSVFDNIESSLKLGHKSVRSSCLYSRPVFDAAQKLANIIGVKNLSDINENLTLQDLSLNDISIEEFAVAIKEANQVSYPTQRLRQMTIQEILSLISNGQFVKNNKFDAGLGTFYTYIDQDECAATEPIITMPTIISNATEKEEDLDTKAAYLMLIPGFEGHHQIFTSVCERLKVQAMTFQLGPDLQDGSIQQIASGIMTFIKKRFELRSKFYLLGYSFGVNVALELAALIEKEGHVGIVYCLDSSPDALRVQLDAYLGNLTDVQLQNTIVEHMYQLMTGEYSPQLTQDLNRIESWDDKVEVCVNRLKECNYSNQYKRSILQAAYRRIMLARNYRPNFKLKSEIVLLKSIPHPKAEKLPDDYNLSQYSTKPITVYNLDSDHALAPEDLKVSNIVNRHLESKVLDEFKSKCLCETYMTESKIL